MKHRKGLLTAVAVLPLALVVCGAGFGQEDREANSEKVSRLHGH